MACGIYKITENETGRCYIGQSHNIVERWKAYKRRFPISKFSYEIIMECDETQLDFWEIAWIASERSVEFGFNKTIGGGSWGMRGNHHSDDTKERIRKAKIGCYGPRNKPIYAKKCGSNEWIKFEDRKQAHIYTGVSLLTIKRRLSGTRNSNHKRSIKWDFCLTGGVLSTQ